MAHVNSIHEQYGYWHKVSTHFTSNVDSETMCLTW